MIRRFAAFWLALAGLAGAAWAQAAAVPSHESIRELAATPRATLVRGTLTAAEADAVMDFEVVLKMRNFPELQKRVGTHERIGRAEMARNFHPAAADYQAAVDWLKGEGFTITQDDPSRLAVFAKGRVADVARAFQTTFARVAVGGREHTSAVTAPNLPAAFAPVVLGVNGLQPHLQPQKHSRVVPLSTTGNGPPFLPSQIAKVYNANGLSQTGAGQTIGIVIDTFPADSDLTSFWTTCGVSQSLTNIQKVQVVAGTLPAPSGEETLDVEWSSSVAPGAKVRVYATLDLSFTHLDQAYAQIYADLPTQPTLHQVSLSYGLGEGYTSTSQMQTDEQYFANLASAGVTVFVSTGDGGSNPTNTGASGGTTAMPESPSNSFSVTAVGGTSLTVDNTTGAETNETVWSGSGGGVSTLFTRPSWQTGAGVPSGTTRVLPDVASAADPGTGCLVILNGANVQYGGTSWSAPTWAGFCALINQARTTSGLGALGLLGPKIYPLLGSGAFRDITAGSNGTYSAGTGFDLCSGLGVPNVTVLLNMLSNTPVFTTQPATQMLPSGQSAAFTVAVSSTTAVSYQWQRIPAGGSVWSNLTNNAIYSGSTTASLTVGNVTAAMHGDQFQCVATNTYGNMASALAVLLIGTPPAPLVVTTLAGSAGTVGSSNGTGSAARFNFPGGIAVDASGNVFVADTGNHTIRKVTPAGVATTFAGSAGVAGRSNTGAGTFNNPSNVAVDGSGNVYVADLGNNSIRKITSAGVVSTYAGSSSGTAGSTNATGTSARFRAPQGVTVDSSGNVFVADTGNNLIRKITTARAVTTLAGGTGFSGSTDATGTAARFNFPVDVSADSSGNVYVADANNQTIRKVTAAGVVTTYAGTASAIGSNDGLGASARFNSPSGVRTDSAGNVYVADASNHLIRRIAPTGIVNTLAGLAGVSGTADGIGTAARFNAPSNAAPDASGNICIVDTNSHTLRKSAPSAAPSFQTQPSSHATVVTQNTTFPVTVSANPAPTYQWQRLPAGGSTWASLTDAGPYSGTATATLTITGVTLAMSGNQFRCTATNVLGSATSAPVTLTVTIPPQITSGSAATFTVGFPGTFTVTATGTPAPTFSATGLPAWASLNTSSGVLSGTPPGVTGAPFAITITASNGAAPAAVQSFTLGVKMTYAGWQSIHFGANAGQASIAGDNADPDNDGLPNLVEYASGSDPLAASAAKAPVATLATNPADGLLHLTLTATLDASATDIIPVAEVSPDLQSWQTGPGYTEVVSDTSSNNIRTLVLRDTTPVTAAARYLRLRINRP